MNGEVVTAEFVEWETKTDDGPVTRVALKLGIKTEDGDTKPDNFWAVGSTKEWQVLDGGKGVGPIVGEQALNKNSNLSFMLQEAAKCGAPIAEWATAPDISVLVGYDFYWQRLPAPVREGLNRNLAPGRENVILAPTKMNSKPTTSATGKKPAAKPAAAAAAKPAAAAAKVAPSAPTAEAVVPDAEIVEGLKDLLNTLLAASNGSANTKTLNGPLVAWMNERNYPSTKVVPILRNADQLAEMGFTREGDTISVAAGPF
ncbi:MAG: hypothetical protein Q7R39_11290 [Dehalococcoidia bacterium]|nr:hypothetical protein [Dehalococcoidia bacterium]